MSAVAESITTTGAWEWRATGTTWRIHHTGGVEAGLAATIAQAVERDEARWSRCRPDSEVARMNASAGRAVHVSCDADPLVVRVYWTRATGASSSRSSAARWSPGLLPQPQRPRRVRPPSPDPRRLEGRPQIDRRRYGDDPAGMRPISAASPRAGWPPGPQASSEAGVTIRPSWSTPAATSSRPAGVISSRWRTLAGPMPRPSPESGSRRARALRPRGSGGAGGRTATAVPRTI